MAQGWAEVFVGVGSNLGDREGAIAEAWRRLQGKDLRLTRASRLYLTEPVGGPAQGWFLNGAFGGRSSLSPEGVLSACLEVEQAMGRERPAPDAPRVIDLDLLLCGDAVIESVSLTLPHPRMHLRRFVLAPLAEIAPSVRHPRLHLTIEELLARCEDAHSVRLQESS